LNINLSSNPYVGVAYQNAIVAFVQALNDAGIYVILDLHWNAPGTNIANQQQPMADQDHAPTFWSSVAVTFKNFPAVIFDLYNEPDVSSWSCWLNGCTVSNYAGTWPTAGMAELVNVIRATGATQPIMLAGLSYATDLSQWLAYVPPDPIQPPQLVASVQSYCGSYNDTSVAECQAALISNQSSQWPTISAVAKSVPVVTSEFGEFDCATTYVTPYMTFADSIGLSYLGWAWDAYGCSSFPSLVSDYAGTPTNYGIGLKSHLTALNKTHDTHDFNSDGNSDIAWRDTSGNTAIWLMSGTTVSNQNSSFVANVAGQWAIVGQRDFNGDGSADLLWRDTGGNVAIWEMNGSAVLNANGSFVANVPTNWSIVGTGDFNGDGLADILWQDTSGNVAIWEMNGIAVSNQNSSFVANVASQWSIKGTGDFNGDGNADILWQDTLGNVAIWEMNGTTILNQDSSFVANVASQWSIKGTGDFNGDGMSDILWVETSGNVAIWEMNGTAILNQNTSFVTDVAAQWSIQLTGDFNGDGMSDILWRDTSGNLAIWEMNGAAVLNPNSSFVANVPGQWSVQHLSAE
jgi:hypothetical protein